MDPDPHPQRRLTACGSLEIEFVEHPLHGERAAHGSLRVIGLRDRSPEVGHQPVTQVLVQRPAQREERLDHATVIVHLRHLDLQERVWRSLAVGLLLIGLLCSAAGCDGLSKEQRREIAKIEQHIRDHPDAIDAADQPGGLTALHVAMLNNYTELARRLLERGANPNAPDGKGEAPLHAAAIFDRRAGCPMTRLLLAHGADVRARNPQGETPLHRAAFHGHTVLAALLLSHGADIQARAGRGESPLHLACAPTPHLDMIHLLIERGADLNAEDQIGAAPLHEAILIGSTEAVRALLEAGARLDATNRSGYTPLHYAAIFGRAAIAAELIRRGAPVNVRDRDGKTPLWRALHAPSMRYDSAGKSQVDTTEVAQVLRGAGGTE